jgi:hypothetical protein
VTVSSTASAATGATASFGELGELGEIQVSRNRGHHKPERHCSYQEVRGRAAGGAYGRWQ